MKKIFLSQGKFSIVDDEDYEIVNKFKWTLNKMGKREYGYRAFKLSGKRIVVPLHRFIVDCPIGLIVDHINGNGLDNRRCNLRICTQSQNHMNQRTQTRKKTSIYKGVCWNKLIKKWASKIKINNKTINIGFFDSEKKASFAYDEKAKLLFGKFALTNEAMKCR